MSGGPANAETAESIRESGSRIATRCMSEPRRRRSIFVFVIGFPFLAVENDQSPFGPSTGLSDRCPVRNRSRRGRGGLVPVVRHRLSPYAEICGVRTLV